MLHSPVYLSARWPSSAYPAAAARLAQEFAALGPHEIRLAASPEAAALLAAIGGNSPYLSDLLLREPATFQKLLAAGPERVVAEALDQLAAAPPTAPRSSVAARLREAKRQVALAVAVADLGGLWPLERICDALSALAEAALDCAVGHLLRAAHDAGEIRLPDPAAPQAGGGLAVLGLGKLGGRELNYSSDIDLVLLYDPSAGTLAAEEAGPFYTRLARSLVRLMADRDEGGYVFRIDLRLRPDPAATPLAVSLPGALIYYESMGEGWERAAFVKARPVAGDRALGAAFLEAIRPFVWRRSLDFAAIADIAAIKRRIDAGTPAQAEAADPLGRLAGFDLKRGRGGIREIEFLAQTLALVWGGREPDLRQKATIPTLRAAARAGHLPKRAAAELATAYHFLRRVEHRLQMQTDRQTHRLADTRAGLNAFAVFLGFADGESFAAAMHRHLKRVARHYAALFESAPATPAGLDLGGEEGPPRETRKLLAAMGFAAPQRIAAGLAGWREGSQRALRSPRARELLLALESDLLAACARQPDPDSAFARFEALLAALPAGVPLLSLFQRNPALLGRVAAVLGAASALAEHLARHPEAIDGLLLAESGPVDPTRALRALLREARGLEETITTTRRFVHAESFQIAVATLEGRLDADTAGTARSALADAALAALLPGVLAEHASRYGRVRGGALAVVVLGKAGGREMMAGSDLDLMLLYDHHPAASLSSGPKRLPVSQYFLRFAHRFVAAILAPGVEGPTFAVDMRLRPSGNKGPVAVSLPAFCRYHEESAWTWERLALTRARVVVGPLAFRARVQEAIQNALRRPDDPQRIRTDTAAMRARLVREAPAAGPWDVKLCRGGLIEVDFIAQALQLIHGPKDPHVFSPTTSEALARLAEAGGLSAEDAASLTAAGHLFRTVQGMLRLALAYPPQAEALPQAVAAALTRAARATDFAALMATLEERKAAVHAAFRRLIGEAWGNNGEIG